MTKRDLVKWLEAKKYEAEETAIETKDKKVTEIKETFYKELGLDEFVDTVIPIFEKAFAEYDKFYKKIENDVEGVTISKYGYRYGYYYVQELTNKDVVRGSLIEAIRSNSFTSEKIAEVNTECKKISETYNTVTETIKNLPTAKDGIDYLKKLGFDISGIQSIEQKKQLPATINVNVDVRYLLLGKKESIK